MKTTWPGLRKRAGSGAHFCSVPRPGCEPGTPRSKRGMIVLFTIGVFQWRKTNVNAANSVRHDCCHRRSTTGESGSSSSPGAWKTCVGDKKDWRGEGRKGQFTHLPMFHKNCGKYPSWPAGGLRGRPCRRAGRPPSRGKRRRCVGFYFSVKQGAQSARQLLHDG